MGCNAHNHPAYCQCGWGGQGRGSSGSRAVVLRTFGATRSSKPATPITAKSYSVSYSSLTIPNAKCPKCHISVFYYQNAFGSRVFFDQLGPPWPKHSCTDTDSWRRDRVTKISAAPSTAKHRADWLDNGWSPFHVSGAKEKRVDLVSYQNGRPLTFALDRPLKGVALKTVYIRKDQSGRFRISLLDAGGSATEYIGKRMKVHEDLSGFLLYCQREREICRAIDAKAEIRKIKSWRHKLSS